MPKEVYKIPYDKGGYPSAAAILIEKGYISAPQQEIRDDIRWATGVDIVYKLKNMTPARFKEASPYLLTLAEQEAQRYKDFKWKFAGFDVKLGRLKKGRDLPEIATFMAAMHEDPAIMVWGEEVLGYEVPQKYFLNNKVDDIIDIAKRYTDKVDKQTPYVVTRLFISIRQPRETPEEGMKQLGRDIAAKTKKGEDIE